MLLALITIRKGRIRMAKKRIDDAIGANGLTAVPIEAVAPRREYIVNNADKENLDI